MKLLDSGGIYFDQKLFSKTMHANMSKVWPYNDQIICQI